MKDIIWTLIILWVVYKIVDIFRSTTVKKSTSYSNYNARSTQQKPEGSVTVEKNDKHGKTPKSNSTDGEYVDFEEIK
jgi:hypothetical protein